MLSQKEVQTIINSPQARMLMKRLCETDATVMEQVQAHIKTGRYSEASALLQPVMNTPEKKQLLQELQNSLG